MRIIIFTGVSGAGKSTALRALEDAGFFCVDNLPLPLMNRFVELLSDAGETEQAAVGVDAREGEFLSSSREVFQALRKEGHQLEVLFLDAGVDGRRGQCARVRPRQRRRARIPRTVAGAARIRPAARRTRRQGILDGGGRLHGGAASIGRGGAGAGETASAAPPSNR